MAKAGRSASNPNSFQKHSASAAKAGRAVQGGAKSIWREFAESGLMILIPIGIFLWILSMVH